MVAPAKRPGTCAGRRAVSVSPRGRAVHEYLGMLKLGKLAVLRSAESIGISRLLSATAWRRRRLLILCYHGISKYDEHEWSGLYMASEKFRRRMELLAEFGCNVLPLTEALQRLRENTLPERAVAITFDDGFQDSYSVAAPILESFGYPFTLYLTTYYVHFNRPVFDPMCSYLLWKGRRGKTLEWPTVLPHPAALDAPGRARAMVAIQHFASSNKLSGREKDDLLSELAGRLGVNYDELCEKRILHLVTYDEARELASRGVDLQYHTHRHRVCRTREGMFTELEENRSHLMRISSNEPRHFCYAYGHHLPEHLAYLKQYGILSATTCTPGLCSSQTDPLVLPRVVDTPAVSDLEFRSWLAGTAQFLPRRSIEVNPGEPAIEKPAPEPVPAVLNL